VEDDLGTDTIPYVDIIAEKDVKVLMGFRSIRPDRNVRAPPGGGFARVKKGFDSLRD
jgi:hypothetical protein